MPELVLKLGDNVIQTYVFDKDVMSIGRSRDNDVVVENLSVSRNHARIRRQTGKYVLTDLNSANGTYVNGVRVSKTEIVDNDVIAIGKHKLQFANQVMGEEQLIADNFGADRTMVVDRNPAPSLCMTDGKLKGQEYVLSKFETSIGKAANNDIVIGEDWFLAKKQAVIIRRGNSEYEIHDMGGFRKTKLNGADVKDPKILSPGDVLEFGNTKCVFQFGGDFPIPTGRVPQEMALEDSIFSSGLGYEFENQPVGANSENITPFTAELDQDAPEADDFDYGAAGMARVALESEARARDSSDDLDAVGTGTSSSGWAGLPPELNLPPTQPSYGDTGSEDELPMAAPLSPDLLNIELGALDLSSLPDIGGIPDPDPVPVPQNNVPENEIIIGSSSGTLAAVNGSHSPDQPPQPMSPTGGRNNRKKRRDKERAPVVENLGSSDELISSNFDPKAFNETVELPPQWKGPATPAIPTESPAHEPAASSPAGIAELQLDTDQQVKQKSENIPQSASQEVALWETALQNRSPVIRRQAAKMLKKLTGRDYEV